jgi:hypothetical protein
MSCQIGNVTISQQRIQGSGNSAVEERQVSGIERVSLTAIGELTIIQGDEEGLTVEADDNIMPYIETVMRGRELYLEIRNGISINPITTIRYTLRVKDLNRISVTGSGNIYADELDVDDLNLSISGSGNMNFGSLNATNLKVTTSGSGNFDLAGTVERQDITITGSGNYRARELESTRANVQISGAGSVTVRAAEELDVRITGFGNVDYYGSPNVSQTISGSGNVRSQGN